MNFTLRIASRYLFARASQAFISVISMMSVLGVAIGVAALIIAWGVYTGFSTDIREKLLGANAHIMLQATYSSAFDDLDPILEQVRSVDQVVNALPFLYTEVMISSNSGVKGLILRGIEPDQGDNPIAILKNLKAGNVGELAQAGRTQGIIVGEGLAELLSLTVGSRVNLLSPSGESTAAGFVPQLTPFKVVGIFSSGMQEYDTNLAFISLTAAQDLLNIPHGRISGVEIIVENPDKAPEVAREIDLLLPNTFFTRDWTVMNANLFAALELERIGMSLVLGVIVLVASFSIITSLVMLVMEKTKDIAIMMSMGASSSMIRNIFMLQGTLIGLVGTTLGVILGLGLAYILKTTEIIKLPKGAYPMDTLPLLIIPTDVIIIVLAALLICFLATIYPARQAAKLEPAKALRYE